MKKSIEKGMQRALAGIRKRKAECIKIWKTSVVLETKQLHSKATNHNMRFDTETQTTIRTRISRNQLN